MATGTTAQRRHTLGSTLGVVVLSSLWAAGGIAQDLDDDVMPEGDDPGGEFDDGDDDIDDDDDIGGGRDDRGSSPPDRTGPLDRDDSLEPGGVDDLPGPDSPAIPQPDAAVRVPRKTRFFRDISYGLGSTSITAIAIDPGDPEIYLAGMDGFVFKSDDGGESWRPTLAFPRGLSADLLVGDDPADAAEDEEPGLLFLDRNATPVDGESVRPNTSDGTTFTPGLVGPEDALPEGDFEQGQGGISLRETAGVRTLRFVSASRGTVYCATPRGAFRSVDAGENWKRLEIPGGGPSNDVRDVAVDPAFPSRIWLATRAGLVKSVDGGATFDLIRVGAGGPLVSALAVQAFGQSTIVVGGPGGVFRSWDGGQTFRRLLLSGQRQAQSVTALAYDPASTTFFVGTPSGLFVAERRMAIFERRIVFSSSNVLSVSVDPARPRGAAVGVLGQGMIITEDGGFSRVPLEEAFPATQARAIARPSDDPDRLVVATERGVFVHQTGSGVQVSNDRARLIMAHVRTEPTLAEVVEAALIHQNAHPSRMSKIDSRARLSGLAPVLSTQYRLTLGRPEGQEEYVLVGDEPDDYDEGDEGDLQELYDLGILQRAPQRGFNHRFWVNAIWRPELLVYNPAEATRSLMRPRQRRNERQVANKVHRLYGARRRLVIEVLLETEAPEPRLSVGRELRFRELTSLLDAITGDAFSRISKNRGGEPDRLPRPPPRPR